ncbi:hypothetical protein F4805DRAFT_458928 [Annulohypoxylon moriforme]|nr:hypothetical protein F4805DRAFT_458928 [Annulohypoxylon moriforme]
MDPLSAVSLAGTIIQFITFTRELLSNASDIYDATQGGLSDVQNLHSISTQLHKFSASLTLQNHLETDAYALAGDPGFKTAVKALDEICRSCKEDCDKIEEIATRLQVKDGGHRRWRSFRAALEFAWKSKEVAELDNRMQRRQAALTLHICAISSAYHRVNMTEIGSLKRTCGIYQIQHAGAIDKVQKTLEAIKRRFLPPTSGPNQLRAQLAPVSNHDMQTLEEQFRSLSVMPHLSRQQAIIASLSFEKRRMRHERIRDAHMKTFEWAYHEKLGDHIHKSQVAEWLSNGSGIFWVSGKPGSGKSTFMKYLADRDETITELTEWARPQMVFIASHYFWVAGTTMQKSRLGLLQELLLEILRQQPQLIEHVVPWNFLSGQSFEDMKRQIWEIKELRETLEFVANRDLNIKFCFFIDGLDEYNGDHLELCDDLHALTKSGRIKICASSRPWNIFKDKLGGDDSKVIFMHDLTRNDIREYTTSRLEEHPRWAHLNGQPKKGQTLIADITDKSRGVFLWVFIVTKLLREGLTNDDNFSELQRRVESFPSDLETFFKHILDTVDSFYHQKMAEALQMAIRAKGPLRYLMYYFYEEEHDNEDYALDMPIRPSPLTLEELKDRHKKVVRRLEGICRGLLEVQGSHVDFLHRTVSDFFETRKMADYLTEKSGPKFNAELTLLRASLASIKTTYFTIMERIGGKYNVGESPLEVHKQIKWAISLALRLEENYPGTVKAVYRLLDSVEESICTMNDNGQHMKLAGPGETGHIVARQLFRRYLIRNHAACFLAWKLTHELDYLDCLDESPLSILVNPDAITKSPLEDSLRSDNNANGVLNLLLVHGENPNEPYSVMGENGDVFEQTPWTAFMSHVISPDGKINYEYMPRLKAPIFLSFLKHGADKSAMIGSHPVDEISTYSTVWIAFLLSVLTMKPGWAEDVEYLEVLDAFLENNTNIYLMIREFFPLLKRGGGETAIRPSYLLQEVTLRLLKLGHSRGWAMVDIWCTIREFFGTRQETLMRNRLGIAPDPQSTCHQANGATRKRKYHGEVEKVVKRIEPATRGN